MPLQTLMLWPTTIFAKKLSSLYSEASLLNGMEVPSKHPPLGKISEQTFFTSFLNGRNKFRHRLEVEHCVRRDGEEIRNFLHRIKKTVDKGWPDDMNGIARAQQNAERHAPARQRRQRCMDYSLRGLRPRYLQSKAQEYLMEHPNATGNDFSTHIFQKDVSFQVSSNFLNAEAD